MFIYLVAPRVLGEALRIFVMARKLFSCSMWDLIPWPGVERGLLYWSFASCTEAQSLNYWTPVKSHKTVLLTTVTMLYISKMARTYILHIWNFVPFDQHLPSLPNHFEPPFYSLSLRVYLF